MSYRKAIDEDMRFTVLEFLNNDVDYTLNDSVLQSALVPLGHNVSRDKLRVELDWLTEMGLITINHVSERILTARITARGQDVANCRTIVSGVKRPRA